jgi:hypothetical protein
MPYQVIKVSVVIVASVSHPRASLMLLLLIIGNYKLWL